MSDQKWWIWLIPVDLLFDQVPEHVKASEVKVPFIRIHRFGEMYRHVTQMRPASP